MKSHAKSRRYLWECRNTANGSYASVLIHPYGLRTSGDAYGVDIIITKRQARSLHNWLGKQLERKDSQ